MKFVSTQNPEITASFKESILSGMAPDGGLYLPEEIPAFSETEIKNLKEASLSEIAFVIAQKFIDGEIPDADLRKICEEAYAFPTHVNMVQNEAFLELFHGPTAAFKDFAARFMGGVTSYFLSQNSLERNLLVATSGDTGGAIGEGFKGLPGVNVFILFPKGGVSSVQEQQLCTMGHNVQAIEVDGTFDDCQALVKTAFNNSEVNQELSLMSANSINVGRVIPQSFYYAWASLEAQKSFPGKKMIFTIPSGNLGNLTGGVLAKMMGFPIEKFIVAHNVNDPFVKYLEDGDFVPKPSVHTLSNAMDIGHPNNFYRLRSLFPELSFMQNIISGASFDDQKTAENLKFVFEEMNYLMCPHTSVGHLATQQFRKNFDEKDYQFITVATAHPGKFRDEVEPIIGQSVSLPPSLESVFEKTPQKRVLLEPSLDLLTEIIQNTK